MQTQSFFSGLNDIRNRLRYSFTIPRFYFVQLTLSTTNFLACFNLSRFMFDDQKIYDNFHSHLSKSTLDFV